MQARRRWIGYTTSKLKVDKQWSVRTSSGFTWWADKSAQKVEILGTEVQEDGDAEYLISVQTDFLRDFEPTDESLTAINEYFRALERAGLVEPSNDSVESGTDSRNTETKSE